MIIYLCIKFESNTLIFSKDIKRKPFFKVSKWAITSIIFGDLHFMIIYLCIKFESNTLIFSKDIEWKPFVLHMGWTEQMGWMGQTYIWTAVILYAPPHPPSPTPTLKMARNKKNLMKGKWLRKQERESNHFCTRHAVLTSFTLLLSFI